MTVTLNLKPEIEAGLLAEARAGGMTVEEYLIRMLENAVLVASNEALSTDERASNFEAWSAAHRETPPLSDYAVSRENMYEGHDR
jgi:hypothetical protein